MLVHDRSISAIKFMELIIIAFGTIYYYIGLIPSIIIIGLIPIYLLLYFGFYKKIIVLSSPVGALCIIISISLSLFMTVIFFMVSASIGMWG